jgi:simple sugar transport system ATP-binding protein
METPFLELRGVTKLFAKVVANKEVSFKVSKGEIVALLGENGAGKSTIMKIVYGLYKADSGSILVDGNKRRIGSPKDAMNLGIAMIQQHFSLVEAHTVTENIILGNIPILYDARTVEKTIGNLAKQHNFDLDPQAIVRDLPVGLRQKVEILKALYQNAKLLIMDEPTAVLTPQEATTLMEFVKQYAATGNSVIFITHKLKEVMDVADRIIVMRNGEVRGDVLRQETDERKLASLMIGHELPPLPEERKEPHWDRELLRVDQASATDRRGTMCLNNVSFSIAEGEILGIAGVSGNGQQELCELICGARVPLAGSIYLDGLCIDAMGIRERIELGIAYVPEDRHRDAMVGEMSVAENFALKSSFSKSYRVGGFMDRRKMTRYAMKKISDYSIKTGGVDALAKEMSGGNQQKVVVAREVDKGSRLIVFNQPTRGLDLGAIDYVHTTILKEREKGKGILLVSTELSEIFALADRVAILYRGAIRGIFRTAELSIEDVGLLMAGYKVNEQAPGLGDGV